MDTDYNEDENEIVEAEDEAEEAADAADGDAVEAAAAEAVGGARELKQRPKAEQEGDVAGAERRQNKLDIAQMLERMQQKADAVALAELQGAAKLATLGKLDAKTIDRVAAHFGNRTDAVIKINNMLEQMGSKFKVTADLVNAGKLGETRVYRLVDRNSGEVAAKEVVQRPRVKEMLEAKPEAKPEVDFKQLLQQKLDQAALKDLGKAADAAMNGKLDAKTIDRVARHFGDRTDVIAKINAQLEAQGSKFKVSAQLISAEKREGGAQTWRYELVHRQSGQTVDKDIVERPATAKKVEIKEVDVKQVIQQKLDRIALQELSNAADAAMNGKLDAKTIDRVAQHFGDRADVVAKINAQLEAQGSKFKLAADLIMAEKRVGGAQTWSYRLLDRNSGDVVAKQIVERPATAKKVFVEVPIKK